MGLWGSFGKSFQKENTSPIIPTIPIIPDEQSKKCNFGDVGDIGGIDTNLKKAQQGGAPAKVKDSPLPEQVEEPKAAAVEVVSTVEDVAAGWGMLPGEVDAVADMARDRFPEPPINGRAFPHFPTFCAGYGKGCQTCRFFRMGRGPFCAVWGIAWPKFQRDAETDTATW